MYKAILTDWNSTGFQHIAVKTMKALSSLADVQSLKSEVIKMQDLQTSLYCVPHWSTSGDQCGCSIVIPNMVNGSLLDFLKKERCILHLDDDSEMDNIVAVREITLKDLSSGWINMVPYMEDWVARRCLLHWLFQTKRKRESQAAVQVDGSRESQ